MQYGYFDDIEREYVITDPHTPVKWINYIGDLSFGGFVDHTGGALLCKQDPTYNRITKYIPQMPASDFKGSTLYLRLHLEDGYKVLTPFYVPGLDPYERYECRVGMGYTRIISQMAGIECDVTIFVPAGQPCELRLMRITNRSEISINLDAVPVVEYTHFDALKQFTNADWVPQTMQSWRVPGTGELTVLAQCAFMKRGVAENYFTASLPASSFETERRGFLGANEYSGWSEPLCLHNPELSCGEARRGDNIGALLLPLGELQPGESRVFTTQLGQAQRVEDEVQAILQRGEVKAAEKALADLRRFWDGYLSALQVHTPDRAMNSMLNVHNPHQCYTTKTWSRYLSLYQTGLGARGIGMRDSAQDVMAVLASVPEQGRDLLLLLLSMQKQDGSAMHQFNPLTLEGSAGDSMEREDRPHYYSDDHLWLVLAACAYLKETGDFELLERQIPFYDKDRDNLPLESATLYEHLRRAVSFTLGDLGSHGLPRLGFADWNDTINLATGAESLLTANLCGLALRELAGLAAARGDAAEEQALRVEYDRLRETVNGQAWDGEWYISYFDADGSPMGSHRNSAGQIYSYGQSWPVLSGFASPEPARSAMNALYERLNTRCGIKTSMPGFNGFNPAQGGVTTYPPGAKENGGIFLHTNPWAIIAETLLGNGERAFLYYCETNPALKNQVIEEFECEPYVYPQNILGDEHPQFGLARNSWLSGTASWMYQAATQYILGLRPEYNGLRVDPCIPPEWDSFQVSRRFRGAIYEIEVRNPGHVSQGISSVELDGQPYPHNLLPVFPAGETHHIILTLGA